MARKKRLDVNEVLDRERAKIEFQEEQSIYQTAGYIRLSVEDSGKTDGYSLENQEKLVRDYIADHIEILGGETLQDGDYEPTFEFMIQPVTNEEVTINADMNFSFEITSSAY